jgi:hypothetical protein
VLGVKRGGYGLRIKVWRNIYMRICIYVYSTPNRYHPIPFSLNDDDDDGGDDDVYLDNNNKKVAKYLP